VRQGKVYLDLCVYNRPFDVQSQPRIMIETLGFIIIMAMVSWGDIDTINSFVLEYENGSNPKSENRVIIADMLQEAFHYVTYSDGIEKRALELESSGIMGIDALHLACAEEGHADYFITCDDALVRKARKIRNIRVDVLPLLEFVSKEVLNEPKD